MAIENKYVLAATAAEKKAPALYTNGTGNIVMQATVEVAAADDNDSIYRLFRDIPANAVPLSIAVYNTAITSGTSYSLGLYKTNLGVVVSAACFASALDVSSARVIATANNAGMTAINIATLAANLGVLSGQSEPDSAYDIAFIAGAVGSAAGTIRVVATFAFI